MSCNCLKIPEGAEVLARATGKCRVVYRLGDRVVKVLKERVTPDYVRSHQAFAAEQSDICEPFEYDLGAHELHQRFMGYDPPSAQELLAIKQTILHRGLSVDDVMPANVRGGKLIDFDLMFFAAVPVTPRGVHRRGRVVTTNSATVEELRALGPLIKWPTSEPLAPS
ncbi:MAG: hypothetical protein DCC68_07535 [Planctomycetota bacterium]|nr:MAG: hypothetical protein DCC68_07535 [Planctomycetota bacterium]